MRRRTAPGLPPKVLRWHIAHVVRLTKKQRRSKPRPGNDEIRWLILRLLYDERLGAGVRKRYLWSDLRGLVRSKLGVTPAETTHNLEYLIQNGWIEKETEPYTGPRFRAFGTVWDLYGISAKAIDLFEEGSVFSSNPLFRSSSSRGTRTSSKWPRTPSRTPRTGTFNPHCSPFSKAVTLSEDLSPEQKIGAIADVKTAQAQILKPEPDRTVLEKLKESLSTLANIAGISSFVLNALHHWPS